MAVRVFQFSVVFAIGFCFGPATGGVVAPAVTEIPLSLYLKNPKDVIVARGKPVTLKCEAQSSAPGLTLSWLYEGNLISSNDSQINVLENGSLHIPEVVGKRMEGKYQCLARNDIGAVLSNSATLKIASIGRDFIEQPENVSIPEEQPIVLPCRIQSTPDAFIHWERDKKPLPQSTRYVPLPLGSLLITSTRSSDAGSYRCIATNKILKKKTKRSRFGQLTVLPPSQNTKPPEILPLGVASNVTVLVGSNLTLYCAVTGWPTPTVQWLYNMSIVMGNLSILELRNVSSDTTGNYSCSAYNTGGSIMMDYHVNVQQAPYFNVTPISIKYPSARTVRLDCQAKGIPQPKIYWLKDGKKLETIGRIKNQLSGLVLSHSFTTDKGLYQCVATNSVGETWVSAQLIPLSSGNRPIPPQNVQCRSFDENSICVTWDPPINITIQAYSVYAFSKVKEHDFVTNYTHYLASGLDNNVNYSLYVRSYSKEASDQSNNVLCKTNLSGERNLKIEVVSNTSVKLIWSSVSNDIPCGSTAAMYKIEWRRIDQSSVNLEYTTTLTKVISGLRSSTYAFRVQSTTTTNIDNKWLTFTFLNNKGTSDTSITSTPNYVETYNEVNDSLVMPQTPAQIDAQPLTPYTVNVSWPNVEENENIFYTLYFINVKEGSSQIIESDLNYVEVKNLKPNTVYQFKVRSESFSGNVSPFSYAVEVRTLDDIPSPVQDLQYRIINKTSVCVRWRSPLHKNGNLVKYVMFYAPNQNWPLEQWLYIDVPITQNSIKNCWPEDDTISVVLSSLKPEARYALLVRAATEAGLGNFTRPLTFSTKDSITGSFYPDIDDDESVVPDSQDELHYKQKLGIALGVSVSFLCILCCVGCIIFRRRCVKTEAMARARLAAASSNYYAPTTNVPYPGTSLQLRNQDSCVAEAYEMQHLVGEDRSSHIPPLIQTHLDTKYNYHDCNGYLNPRESSKQDGVLSSLKNCKRTKNQQTSANGNKKPKLSETVSRSQELVQNHTQASDDSDNIECDDGVLNDSTSPVLKSSEKPISENGKVNKENNCQIPDYNSNCNSELNEMYNSNLKQRVSLPDLSKDNSLNSTQLTCLEDSFTAVPASRRRLSPALGPNG